jgi:hypothetical protein
VILFKEKGLISKVLYFSVFKKLSIKRSKEFSKISKRLLDKNQGAVLKPLVKDNTLGIKKE